MIEYDPYSIDVKRDPYPSYRALRDDAPAYHNAALDFWALSRFDDVIDALHDPATYCSGQGIVLEAMTRSPYPMIIALDPPRHTDLRKLVSRAFGTKPTNAFEPQVRARARELLAQFSGSGTVDLVPSFSAALPLAVIGDIVGVPADERAWFRHQGEILMSQQPDRPETLSAARAASGELLGRFTDLIAERRSAPTGDLVSGLIAAEEDGERLTADEIVGFCYLLILAGHETTMNLISNGVITLQRHPAERALVEADPTRITNMVEEVLRYESPVHSQARTTTRDVELHGEVIPEGKKVLLLFASAGRDERAFPDPDRFDVTRTIERHLSFGHGIHHCLGAALARLEARVAFEELFATLPDWRVTSDVDALDYVPSYQIRGPVCLDVEFTPVR
ncbi:MAG TPA: cytochrome P450 [Acidimicrobiia bacterium]|nr:cytochrome P450 [Acidimicrobiia bacterium]